VILIADRPGTAHTEPSGRRSSNRKDVGTDTEDPLIAVQIWAASNAGATGS